MEAISNIESLIAKTTNLVEAKTTLWKLKMVDKTSETVSGIASSIILAIFILFSLIILSIGLALLIGEQFEKNYYGFFIIAGFYALISLILFLFRNKIMKMPIANSIINNFLK